MKWELEEEETSDGPAWSVYDEHGERLTTAFIGFKEACVIAAAPELLAALQEWLCADNSESGIARKAAKAQARAAIAKATDYAIKR